MKSGVLSARSFWAVLSTLSLAGLPLAATTYVPMTDADLVDQAQVAAIVTVASAEPSPADAATDYTVQIEEVLKGSVSGSSLIVRVPGVERPGGQSLRIWGAPHFAPGERALVLLSPRPDGTYGIQQMMLGAFHEIKSGGKKFAVRSLDEAQAIQLPGHPALPEPVRDFDRFREWISSRAADPKAAVPDYLVTAPAPAALQVAVSPFTLLRINNLPIRWFEFDNGGAVNWRAHNVGLSGFPGGGYSELQTAINVWNAEPETPISYNYLGRGNVSLGLTTFDGVNALLFNDPNQEISGTFNCNQGGVLAIGGPWFDTNIRDTFKGTTYLRTAGADIVVNDGIACFLQSDTLPLRELLAHELGHTLGLGHSSESRSEPNATLRDALMYFAVHNDGRGAVLKADDLAGIRQVYKPGVATVPAAPSNLTATATGLNTVRLTFRDNSTDETDFVIEQRLAGGTFTAVATAAAATGTSATPTVTVTGLTQSTAYGFRVRARNAAGTSNPTNEATVTTFSPPSVCLENAQTLCLKNNRFRVTTTWKTANGSTGPGTGDEITPDTGYFTFFSAENVEVVVKVIDACALNGRYWVFAGGLSNVEVVTTVTDVQTGATKTYTNTQGVAFAPLQDTDAFSTCP
jgi:hypothetical protein